MEKFNFNFIAKTLVLLFGLSSLCLTSCRSEDVDDNEPAPPGWNEREAKEILADGFTADYPLNFPLRAYPSSTPFTVRGVGSDKHVDSFYVFITYDSTSVNKDSTSYDAVIQYMKLTSPSTVAQSEIDDIVSVFKEFYFNKEDIVVDEATTFAGYPAHRLTSVYKESNGGQKKIEYNLFYIPAQKKVYIALISLSEELYKTRRDELFKIASTFRIK